MIKRPLLVLVLAYILGIVSGNYCKLSLLLHGKQIFYLFWLLSGIFFLTLLFFFQNKSLFTNVFLLLSFFLLGVFFYLSGSNVPDKIAEEVGTFTGTVVKEAEVREEKVFLTVKAEGISGLTRVIIYNSHASYEYGEKLIIKGEPERALGLRNPGGFNYQAYLARKGIHTLIKVKDEENIERIGIGKVNPAVKFALKTKEKMIGIIRQSLKDPQAAVLEGIMFGKRSSLPKEIREDFSNTGVGHILAVSGLHVMLILFMFFTLFRALRLSARLSGILTIILIVFYALIVGGRPSVIRASVMAITGLSALLLDRERDFLTAIALAAFIILLINPLSLFEISFQLSFIVVLSIIYSAPGLKGIGLKLLPPWLALSLSVSLAAWLGALPLIAHYFHKFSPVTVVANLLVVPLTGATVALGLLTSLSGLVSPGLARIWGGAANWLTLSALIKSVRLFASLPGAFLSFSLPSVFLIIGYYGGLATLFHFLPDPRRSLSPGSKGEDK